MHNNTIKDSVRLSSLKMIDATIINDMPTRYWALHLIKAARYPVYLPLQTLHLTGLALKLIVIYLVFAMTILGNITPQIIVIFFLAGVAAIGVETLERKHIRNAAMLIFKEHYTDSDLSKYTLYHLTEEISRRFALPSLIDMVARSNVSARLTFLILNLAVIAFLQQRESFLIFILWALIIVPFSKVLYAEALALGRKISPKKS